jgi:hypothetical protein
MIDTGDRVRVRIEEANRGNVEEEMLSWSPSEGRGCSECEADRATREKLCGSESGRRTCVCWTGMRRVRREGRRIVRVEA